MLKRLRLCNFKSWRQAEVDFGRVTGLFGTNSSGKSSLVQFLLLLKQTKESTDRGTALDLNGRFVRLGTAADVIHAHDESSEIDFELGFEHGTDFRVRDPSSRGETAIPSSKSLAVHAEVEIFRQAFRSRKLAYSVGESRFELAPRANGRNGFGLFAEVPPGADFSFRRTTGRVWPLPRPVKTYRFPDQVRAYFQKCRLSH